MNQRIAAATVLTSVMRIEKYLLILFSGPPLLHQQTGSIKIKKRAVYRTLALLANAASVSHEDTHITEHILVF